MPYTWEVSGYRIYGFCFQAEDGIRGTSVTGVQTCALPISLNSISASIYRGTRQETGCPCSHGASLPFRSPGLAIGTRPASKIGRASCRERGWMSGGGVAVESQMVE